jgi:hypothetical protein
LSAISGVFERRPAAVNSPLGGHEKHGNVSRPVQFEQIQCAGYFGIIQDPRVIHSGPNGKLRTASIGLRHFTAAGSKRSSCLRKSRPGLKCGGYSFCMLIPGTVQLVQAQNCRGLSAVQFTQAGADRTCRSGDRAMIHGLCFLKAHARRVDLRTLTAKIAAALPAPIQECLNR